MLNEPISEWIRRHVDVTKPLLVTRAGRYSVYVGTRSGGLMVISKGLFTEVKPSLIYIGGE